MLRLDLSVSIIIYHPRLDSNWSPQQPGTDSSRYFLIMIISSHLIIDGTLNTAEKTKRCQTSRKYLTTFPSIIHGNLSSLLDRTIFGTDINIFSDLQNKPWNQENKQRKNMKYFQDFWIFSLIILLNTLRISIDWLCPAEYFDRI